MRYHIREGIYHGKVCWVGKIKEVSDDLVAGVEMVSSKFNKIEFIMFCIVVREITDSLYKNNSL